jgi:hypothetical protein
MPKSPLELVCPTTQGDYFSLSHWLRRCVIRCPALRLHR